MMALGSLSFGLVFSAQNGHTDGYSWLPFSGAAQYAAAAVFGGILVLAFFYASYKATRGPFRAVQVLEGAIGPEIVQMDWSRQRRWDKHAH